MLAGECRCENVCWVWSVNGVWACGRVGTCDRESGLAKKLRARLKARLRQGCVRAGSPWPELGGWAVVWKWPRPGQALRWSAQCAGRAAAPGVQSWMSSLGWDPRGAAGLFARSSRPANLNHAGSQPRPGWRPEGRGEGMGPLGWGADGPLGARGPGAAEPGDPGGPLPGRGGSRRRLIDSGDVRGGVVPAGREGGGES